MYLNVLQAYFIGTRRYLVRVRATVPYRTVPTRNRGLLWLVSEVAHDSLGVLLFWFVVARRASLSNGDARAVSFKPACSRKGWAARTGSG